MSESGNQELYSGGDPRRVDSEWAMYFVLHWSGGEPLEEWQQEAMDEYFAAAPNKDDVFGLSFVAHEDLPYIQIALGAHLTHAEVRLARQLALEDDEDMSPETDVERKKKAALSKGLVTCLGALAAAEVPLSVLEYDTAHLAAVDQLPDRSLGFIDEPDYAQAELGFGVFRDETALYTDFLQLAA